METTQEEVHFEELDELINKILISYVVRDPSQSDDEWLMQTFSKNLPEEIATRVIELCTEVKESSEQMNNFLLEARSSPKYEFKSQNWFYDKIKSSIKSGDFELFKKFHHQNAILDNINKWSLEISREFREMATHKPALTGVCGMMLTSSLSLLLRGTVRSKVISGAIKVGATDGIKMALTAALKVGAEKRILPILTRATPMLALTAMSLIAVESTKLMLRYSRGEIKCFEAFNQVSKISTSALCAVSCGIKGAFIGATAFASIPVAGSFIGAFIGELIGNSIGYSVGRKAHSKISLLIMNAKDIVSAHYGILQHLVSQTVALKQKEKLYLWS